MKKFNKVRAVVVSALLAFAALAPVASIVANAPNGRTATMMNSNVEAPAMAAATQTVEIETGEIVIVGSTPKAKKSSKSPSCHSQKLEQQGRPGAEYVRVCL